MVDKYAVKQYVADCIGEQYVIKTYGVWNSFDEINFNSLPNQFVLKTTHGGGGSGVVVCYDKAKFDLKKAKLTIEMSMRGDIYRAFREWPYKDVPKRIIAEELICEDSSELRDYKFFCFNGEPKFLKVDFDRFTAHRANYYDMNWNLQSFGERDYKPNPEYKIECPPNFEMMMEFARKLSKGHPFLRVDMYNVNGIIYFGELTFFPAAGFGKFTPIGTDEMLGSLINLPITPKKNNLLG